MSVCVRLNNISDRLRLGKRMYQSFLSHGTRRIEYHDYISHHWNDSRTDRWATPLRLTVRKYFGRKTIVYLFELLNFFLM